ncbi:MAG: TetR/AcrR family transcriptional regulator [Porticoccaceae bacterium]|nr:TetR/AcrR family transcriptional regulator [Porticoccaceae bacterium]
MKRKEVILRVSLALFNEQGESNITSVDIANEMEISPGNLYYHFKGKEEIIASLVQNFAAEIGTVVAASQRVDKALSARWLLIYLILETVYLHRFFFRNIPDIIYNYPESGKALVKILNQLENLFSHSLLSLADSETIAISPVQKNLVAKLVKSIMLVIVYWESYQVLARQSLTETQFVQDASLQILSLISPYLRDEQIRDIHQCHQQYLRDRVARAVI